MINITELGRSRCVYSDSELVDDNGCDKDSNYTIEDDEKLHDDDFQYIFILFLFIKLKNILRSSKSKCKFFNIYANTTTYICFSLHLGITKTFIEIN